jgi:phage tail sheath gpL-like
VTLCGRNGVDGVPYAVNIATGDTPTVIAGKIKDAINAVLGAPVTSTSSAGVVTNTAKWVGLTSNDIVTAIDLNGTSLGVTYAFAVTTAGTGTPTAGVTTALNLFSNQWNNIVVNGYGTVSAVMDALETFNGIPDPTNPTGRYGGLMFKPFIAITGSTADDPTSITDARLNNVTIAIAPAPLSAGLPIEAAANMTYLFARVAQDTPHLDVQGLVYPDMPLPLPTVTPAFQDYNTRDLAVKKGCSTVHVSSGQWKVNDFVTTYHPTGETPPQYRYCRNLFIDFNVRFAYYLKQVDYQLNHVIAKDDAVVSAEKVIKPKQWRQIVGGLADDLTNRALIADAKFMKDSIVVVVSGINPARIETTFKYQRTEMLRIESTTATAGFYFGG